MLLPSALSCDSAQPSRPRLQSALFVSPPASPPTLSTPQSSIGNIVGACRSLQSLMASPLPAVPTFASSPPPSLASLPTPPLSHAPPPLKLRLRAVRPDDAAAPGATPQGSLFARRRITKRLAPPPGPNKRRRTDEHDMGREHRAPDEQDDVNSDADSSSDDGPAPPSTPKRARIAPEHLPLGLARSDFHDVHLLNGCGQAGVEADADADADAEVEADGAAWSAEDDRILVELVLDKLRLSKTEWQDCARSLGKDRHSVGRRWQSLMARGDIGLKARGGSRRARLHATWR
ncbi:hypothetical protein CDD83_5505 [Cordyceps sp. RAO-2017]|nr:hypothetical protein CDD83_5505 [Cordyceps sp. RAO-2017]